MAEISLRAYMKEIEDLIERDHLDEAIAHCRRILEVYPKHLDSYRLLGKSYLESKRYGDAADIFQRVLSAIPDDFVSHIGMAIVREDEGNLDSAIWHMERAFETNPANPAIRQELRRLIGNRDGLEPHKVRMTRGALARMYAQGELYPQAISELDFALKEDADRPDLQVLLATMYFRTGQSAEAAEICNGILEKLPFCRDANRIMASILQTSKKTDEASMYNRRLAALDPYAAFVESATIDPKTVSANSVRIDRTDWSPGQPASAPETGQPDWAVSLGVSLGEGEPAQPEPSAESSWMEDLDMSSIDPESEAPNPPSEESDVPLEPQPPSESVGEPESDAEKDSSEGAEIPDWMREAGWGDATGEAQDGPVSFSDDELSALDSGQPLPEGEPPPQEDADLTPAEIPDWVQQIAPSEAELVEEDDERALPNWLGDIAADAEAVSPEPRLEDTSPVAEAIPEAPPIEEIPGPSEEALELDDDEATPLPAWLDDDEPGATSTIITWLDDRAAADLGISEEAPAEPIQADPADIPFRGEPATDEERLPDWLGSEAEEAVETPAFVERVDEEQAPSWLAGVAEAAQLSDDISLPEEIQTSPEPPAETPESDELDFPAEDLEGEPTPTTEAPDWIQSITSERDEPTAQLAKGAPDWLDGIAEPEELPISDEGLPSEHEPTDWLKGIAESEPEPEPVPEPVEAAPDWLEGIAEPDPEPVVGEQDWLKGLREAEATATEQTVPADESFDWLEDLAPDEPEIPAEPAEFPLDFEAADITMELPAEPVETVAAAPETASASASSDEIDDQEIFDWLEDLAAKQEAVPEESETPSELPSFEPPTMDDGVHEAPIEPIPEEPEQGLEWLDQLATERGMDVDVGMEPILEELAPAEMAVDEDALVTPEPMAKEPEIQTEITADVEAPLPTEEIEWEAGPALIHDHEPLEPLPVDILPETPVLEPDVPEIVEEQVFPDEVLEPALESELDAITPIDETLPPLDAEEDLVPEWLLEPDEVTLPSVPTEEATAELEMPVFETEPEVVEPEPIETPDFQPGPEAVEPTPIAAEEQVPEPVTAEPIVPEPVAAEPDVIEPVAPEPVVPEPVAAEPVVTEPVAPEPVVPEPVAAEPVVTEPVAPEPVAAEPVVSEPVAPEPVAPEPVAAEPVVSEPVAPEPVAPEPVVAEPVVSEPVAPEPVVPEPVVPEPVAAEPVVSEPVAPEPVVPEPVAAEPVVTEPIAAEPVVPEPVSAEPVVAEPVAAEPVAAEPPPPPKVKPMASKPDATKLLEDARQALASEDFETAIVEYGTLIKRKINLKIVIDDLRLALDRNPKAPALWQALGDAYMKANKLTDAIQAYQRGTEVA
jgi:tetratricopeptide (TPR) repeat protein